MKSRISVVLLASFFGIFGGGLPSEASAETHFGQNFDSEKLLALNLFGGSGGETLSEADFTPGWHEGSLSHDGSERVFRYYVPEDLSETPSVVMLLHGASRSMDEIFRNRAGGTNEWPEVAEEEGFLLLVPNGTSRLLGNPRGNNQQWNDCQVRGSDADDVGFISELIDWSDQQVDIDNDRVYVTGTSNGGLMVYRMARELDNKIAAVAAFVANKAKNDECRGSEGSVPVMMVNGTEDTTMPYDGGRVSGGLRGPVVSTEETVDYWTSQNGVSSEPASTKSLPDRSQQDRSQVTRNRYGQSELGAPVVFYKVTGGGHWMPSVDHEASRLAEISFGDQNNDVEGARIAWKFLSQFTR